MDNPGISAVCPVYGGVTWLENALDCFLKQDYDGPKELLVVNSFPGQTLRGEFPNVRIVNLSARPENLGALRNLCVQGAKGDIIVTWDSDDIFLPNHLSTIAAHFKDNDWIWLKSQFWIMGDQIESIVKGACPLFSFRKTAWDAVGGYPMLTVGEDMGIIGKITERFNGTKVELQPEEITFGYRWGQGSHHVSGEGADMPGKTTAHDRAYFALQERIRKGQEKFGEIVLSPNNPIDWPAKAKAFLVAQKKTLSVNSIAFVALGRYGDIVNLLPILKHCAENYTKPHLVISREFAPLLEGVSYVEPYPVDLRHNQIVPALEIAKRNFKHVINCAIWGTNFEITRVCASYNRESWRMAGFAHKFNDLTWYPIFDRRNGERERALWSKLDNGKPMILVNVSKSVSSPFKQGEKILRLIQDSFGSGCNVVDLSALMLPQIYDLVSVMEKAAVLVSIDTSHLHLAAATSIPVVALTNPLPWQGTEPRCNWISKMTYTEAERQPMAVRSAIIQALKRERYNSSPVKLTTPPQRTIYHVVERHKETNPKEAQRKATAQASWSVLYAPGVIPCHVSEDRYPRNSLSIGDTRSLPYLKDVLKAGMDAAGPNDIIMLTNDDNWLHPEIAEMVRFHCSLWEVVCAQRCEFKDSAIPVSATPSKIAALGQMHNGRDLFAFTKAWLDRHWKEIPDAILGARDWDWMLCSMIRRHLGIDTDRKNIEQNIWPAEMERGYVAHQYHDAHWKKPAVYNTSAANLHNRMLYEQWNGGSGVKTITVRRSGAYGDAIAATCVASRLAEKGHHVVFQTSKEVQRLLRYCPGLTLADPMGPCDVNLDGAYENHPERKNLHFSEIFTEASNAQLGKEFGIQPLNCSPKLVVDDPETLAFIKRFNHLPQPWIAIGARSNSFNVRTVPDETWRQVAAGIKGTCFWIATHAPPPDGIVSIGAKGIEDVVAAIYCCDLFIGVDSGPLHIAAALGVPCIAIEQSSSPLLHLSDQRDFIAIGANLDCLNCQLHRCPINAEHPPCQDIPWIDVVNCANRRLNESVTVSAVIPIYRPDVATLNKCIECVLPQVDEVIVTLEANSVLPTGVIHEPQIRFCATHQANIGYGRNVNFGARHSNGKYLLLLNDDVFLDLGAVEAMLAEMQEDVGAVTHTLWYPNGTVYYAGKYRKPGARGWDHIDLKSRTLTWKEACDTECACAASMLVRRKAFYQVNGFDEEYYLYSEDDDLALRLRQNGWRLRYTPKASGTHLEHASTDKISNIKDHVRISDQLFQKKWKRYLDWNANRVPGNFEYENI